MSAIAVRTPRTGKNDASFTPPSNRELTAMAADLRAAQKDWHSLGLEHRIKTLQAWKAELPRHNDALLKALATDTGRHLLAAWEVHSLPTSIDHWCNMARRLNETPGTHPTSTPNVHFKTEYAPYPLIITISPWNYPLILSLIDALPALCAGCAVIVKPSEVTPRFIEPLMRSVEAVPNLHKVFRLVAGAGETGAALGDLGDVVCFTGSVATGRKVGEQAAANFIPTFLELGGKDPLIVLQSADVEQAAQIAFRGSVIGTGQACQSVERIYVTKPLYAAFVERLVKLEKDAKLNYPDIHSGTIGPLIFEKQATLIENQLSDAIAKGAKVRTGGKIENHGGGKWCRPTVLTNVTHDMTLMQEETFGPLMPVMAFECVDDAIALANDSPFGLSASVIAKTSQEAIDVAKRLEVGAVSINDAGLTSFIRDAEKNSFNLSGIGGSRMGDMASHVF